MITRSIFLKLFILTSVVISLFIGGMLMVQTTFFEGFYARQKTFSIQINTIDLAQTFSDVENPFGEEAAKAAVLFSLENNSSVFYEELNQKDEDKANFGAYTSSAYTQSTYFLQEQLYNGKTFYEENRDLMKTQGYLSFDTLDDAGNTTVITISSVSSGEEDEGLLYVITSLQPIYEAEAVMKDYYGFFFGIGILFTLIIAYLFSRQISKPLLHMNRVTNKIAQLDFSEECTIQSKDELGSLSRSINALSNNLSQTIQNLKQSNHKLVEELEKQKELDKMRKDFIADASHELKTPLSVIQGYSEGLLDNLQSGEIKEEYLKIILDETEKMNKLVSNMLELSELESGRTSLNPEVFSIQRLIRYVTKRLSPAISDKNIELKLEWEKDEFLVKADSFRIEQVLCNLLNNAIRYSPEGGLIKINAWEKNKKVWLSVQNNGPTISVEELKKIWDKFYRVEKSRNKELGGSGLGLSIIKNILELHGSEFGARNTSEGVEFYFSLVGGE